MDPNLVGRTAEQGVVALLGLIIFAIVVGGWRGWYVFRRVLDERDKQWDRLLEARDKQWERLVGEKDAQIRALQEDRDEWRQLAERRQDILERSITVASRPARADPP